MVPAGKRIAMGCADGWLRIFDIESGDPLQWSTLHEVDHGSSVDSLAFDEGGIDMCFDMCMVCVWICGMTGKPDVRM